MNYERTTLQNGLRLLTAQMPGMRSASIGFFFSVGSRYEEDRIAGVSHFIEHMLFKGTRRYPSAKHISEAIEGVGGVFNGSTGKEITHYTARVPGEYLENVLDVLADMVRHPLFLPEELEKERNVIIEELSSTQDDPAEWVSLLADEVMWPDLPLGRDDAGTIDSVKGLKREDMLSFLNSYYRPNSLVISIAGNIDPQQSKQLVEKYFADWEAKQGPRWKLSLPPRDVSAVRSIQKATEQTNICLATLGVSYLSPDYYPFLLLNALLGDGMSSRLFLSIREEQGLAYDIGSYYNSYNETGSLVISAGVDPAHTKKTIRAIVKELQRLCDEPIPQDELERIKAYMRGGLWLGLEGTQQVASWLGSQECLQNRVRSMEETEQRMNAVTAQDIQRVARYCFAPEWRRLAIIGPENVRHAEYFNTLLTGV
ncbi:putative Zn-dependent peptidase [Thermosporothrix hazakensis]|jgi:predicted Zn-dependent peptidase|uniref:Peptidase M16 n=2 Tax=Thermosporothrix TaxID=768650 RepID=A0A455SQK5_9CHLR|nr:pitrilysin family protein [Thermosporothrix hazakensis]PZW35998.1 putative Zn-dependent peptidase [Thermosporothrix hazakensis]BBH88465.1 peptidase M16 [Thermosporothrix sp. COM3]GCE46652.1 peptidase M16 [Thermosporothrix hazakensis]